jgi:WD40 repeat protein
MRKLVIMAALLLFIAPVLAQDTLRLSFLTQYASISRIVFSPDGQSLATVSFAYDDNNVFGGSIQLWDTTTGLVTGSIESKVGQPVSAAFNADGTLLFTGLDSGQVAVWNLSDYQMVNNAAAHNLAPEVVISADGSLLVSSDSSGTIVWDAAAFTPQLILTPDAGDTALLLRTLICPDKTCIAGVYSTGELRFRSLADGSLLTTMNPGYEVEPFTAAFSPDGLAVALGYETLELWNPQAGVKMGELATGAAMFDAAFSPDGTQVATADADGRLILWDFALRQPVQTLAEGINFAWDIAFSPDGAMLALARDEGEVELYALK